MISESRYSRNELLFGIGGQVSIGTTSVAIVGLGGLGSHAAQQLAHLGTEDFVLVDHDTATLSSLNRLIGARPEDVAEQRPKVDIAARMIRSIQPEARVRAINARVGDAGARAAVASCDVVFGCLDEDPPRLLLVELSAASRRPYFDLASDVAADGRQYGGRILASIGGEGCLSCMGMLDQNSLREATQTASQSLEEDRIYGVRRSALGETGPSVVSINGVVASLAVTEFMVWVTGMRAPMLHLVYHADRGIVATSQDQPTALCYYCGR